MLFLGTGAAELYPNPYCNCEFGESLRQSGEAPRKRSSLLLDAHTLVDLGPDALAAAQMYNARLYDVDHLFLTHSHEDHLCITNLEVLTMTPQRNEKPLHVYLSEPAHVFLTRYMQALRGVYAQGETGLETLIKRGVVELHSFPSYVPVRVGGMEVFAIESNHTAHGPNEHALNYVFSREGEKLLYAADTGLYSEENLRALAGMGIQTLVMEGTFGDVPVNPETATHLNAEHFVLQLQRLLDCGALAQDARVYMTHINQVQHLCHAAYQAYMDAHSPIPVVVASDGLRAR